MQSRKRKTPEEYLSSFERLSLFDCKTKNAFDKYSIERYISVDDAFSNSSPDPEISAIMGELKL